MAIYELALRTLQRDPQSCLFIDDRPNNLKPAESLGIGTIHYRDPEQLLRELLSNDVRMAAGLPQIGTTT